MLTVHHLENSQSIRILWLLEELGVEYDLKIYKRDSKTQLAPIEYKKISPLKTAPTITNGDITLSETNAIVDYLLDIYDLQHKFRPLPDSKNRIKYLFWFHAIQGSLQPIVTMSRVFGIMKTKVPFFLKPIAEIIVNGVERSFLKPRYEAILQLVENDLGNTKWLTADHLTAADIVMGFSLEKAIERAPIYKENNPNVFRFIEEMKKRPAYKRALSKISS